MKPQTKTPGVKIMATLGSMISPFGPMGIAVGPNR